MSFWAIDWFNLRKVAELQSDIAKANKSLAELGDKLILCQSEKSKAISDSKILEGRLTSALSSNAELNDEIAALKDSQNSDAGLLKEIAELQATCKRRQGTIDNLQTQRDELQEELSHYSHAKDITPKDLTDYLIAKYPPGSDVAKEWDAWDLALINAFAVTQEEDPKLLSPMEFESEIKKYFPNAVWHSSAKDGAYFACRKDIARQIIRNDFGNLMVYVSEKKDCDKFAQALRVHFWQVYGYNNVVEVWGNVGFYHSWNLIVCSDGVLMVEPQNDTIAELPDILSNYNLEVIHDW